MTWYAESGFVDKNNPTLHEIYRVAQHHVSDEYKQTYANIVERWGADTAIECGAPEELANSLLNFSEEVEG